MSKPNVKGDCPNVGLTHLAVQTFSTLDTMVPGSVEKHLSSTTNSTPTCSETQALTQRACADTELSATDN